MHLGQSNDPGAARRSGGHQHRLTQDSSTNGSPTQSPRRRRKHRQLSGNSDNNTFGATISGILPNGYTDSHDASQQDVTISLSALSRGRISDSFEIEDVTLTDNTPQHLSAVPNIECRQSVLNQGATWNCASADHASGNQAYGIDNHSASVVGISPNLNSIAGHTERIITMGENQVDGINGACNGNSDKEINTEERRNKVANHFTRNTPPPLPPRKYKTKGLVGERLRLKDHANNSIMPELTVPQGLPSKENTSSFDSMEAFSGSQENMTVNSAAVSRPAATGIPEEVSLQECNASTGQNNGANAATTSTNPNVATLNVQLEGTVRGQCETDFQTDRPITPTERAHNKTESFDESGATSESYESASESMGTSEEAVLQTADSPVKSHNNACTAAGSFVTSIAAQLARIPSIESAVSEHTCCPTRVKQQSSVESVPEDNQQMSASMHDSVYSSNEAGVPSTGAKAHLVVTAQPTGHETSRPVLMGMAHSHAVPLTAVIPVTSELSGQNSSSSDHSDTSNQQGLTKHISVHMQQINGKHKQPPTQQSRVAVIKPVPAPRKITRQGSQETTDIVFTFTGDSSGNSDSAAAGQQEDEPLSPRRKLLSDQERQQNRQQIQEQLARWHHQRRQTGVSPPQGRSAHESSPSHTSSQGAVISNQSQSSQQGSPSHTATQPTVQPKLRTVQTDISQEQGPAASTTSVMSSNVSVVLNTNSSMPIRNTQQATREARQPPPPPPRDGSTLSAPVTGAVSQTSSITAPVTTPAYTIPPQPPPRDGSTLTSNEDQPITTTVSSMTTMPFAMTTVLTTGHTNTASQPSQQPASQVTTITQQPGNQLSMHISNNNRDFSATREAIQQRLLQWHQLQQQLHRQNSGQPQHHSAQNISTSLPTQQHSLNHPVLPQLCALQQQGRSNHQVGNLPMS